MSRGKGSGMDLSPCPRSRYSRVATPLEPLLRSSAELAANRNGGVGPQVWVKHNDLLGRFPGGNKTSKLEFLVAARWPEARTRR
jgi:1-aminocyclopropane-1-carboxylate deaminase/D-cysteine desulfhydrase-like pyridoxal-dependent ACC family enzyme